MAYYDILIAAWNNATQPPPGVTGTGLTGGMTTAQKLAAVNAWTVIVPKQALLTPSAILQATVQADLSALGTANFSLLAILLTGTLVDMSPGTIRQAINAMFVGKTTTLANLAALVAPFDNATQLWYLANGYHRAFDLGDCAAAGVS